MDGLATLKRVMAAVVDYLEEKTENEFRRGLWRAVLELYRAEGGIRDFEDSFLYWIETQLKRAWNAGGRDVGVEPEEHTEEDTTELQNIIANELGFVNGLADEIVAAREAEAGWDQFRSRIDMWALRYTDVQNRARVWFGGRENLVWRLGATEEHCKTCNALNGIVAWASEWQLADVHPQSPPNDDLECGGWQCLCTLEATDEPRNRNAYQRILSALG